jgi:hypothetical protein
MGKMARREKDVDSTLRTATRAPNSEKPIT